MTTTERTALQDELATLRARGWTLSSIARHINVPRQTVQRWWLGTRQPRFEGLILRSLVTLRDMDTPPRRVAAENDDHGG